MVVRSALLLFSLLTPRRWDSQLVTLLWKTARIIKPPLEERVATLTKRQGVLNDKGSRAEDRVNEYLRRRWEIYWGGFRALGRRGWQVQVDWEGEEYLTAALKRRKGVVLWFYSFCENLIMLRALGEKGYTVTHLSRIDHGAPSKSFVALGLLGGFARYAEGRYLAKRIVIHRKLTPASMRRVERALAENDCVTVRGDQSATPGIAATLFDKPICLAPGAPSLAWKTGAALITIGLYRKGFDRYGLRVDPAIEVNRTADRKIAVRRAASVFTERLQQRVAAYPEDWYGWEQDPRFWVRDSVPEKPLVARE